MATKRVDRVVTRGIFSLDGEDFEVDNNIWIVGDDHACFVIDAAHEVDPIVEGVGDRQALMILCTHGHNDHINAAVKLADILHAPVALHPADRMLWDAVHPRRAPEVELEHGGAIEYKDLTLTMLHTPGHSPGGISFHDQANKRVFSGDTLFKGGPGATGRSFSDFSTLVESIRTRLLTLPADTVVHTGHGESTRIGDEAANIDEWISRGS